MFSKTIIDSDAFLDMPLSAQALYFHLSMRADDEGFVNNPNKIQRMINASGDDMKILLAKNFIIQFENGVIVIKHWKIHNYIRSDRITPTAYQEERQLLELKENGSYTLNKELETLENTECQSNVSQMSVKCQSNVSIGKDSIGKDSIGEDKEYIPDPSEEPEPKSEKKTRHKHGEYGHVLLTDDQYQKLIDEYGEIATERAIKKVDEYCEEKGKTYKNYYLTLKKWGYDSDKKTTGNTYVDAINNRITQMKDW